MKQLKVAIIGQGRSGYSIHGSFLIDNKDRFKVVAVVDLIEKRRLLAKERYGEDVITSDNYQDLFDMNLDLVINSSYSHMHYSITKDLLMHGFNVLTEKPFCGTADEVQDLIDTAKEKKCMLAVFQNSRFAAYYMKVKEILDSKVLGDIIQVSINFSGFERRWDWQTLQSYNAGNLFNTGPHPLDQALQIFGEGMPNVKAFMRRVNTYGDAEDYAKIILYGQDKPLIDLEVTSCQGYKPYVYNIQGSKGALNGTMTKIDWKYFKTEELPEQKLLISFDKEGTDTPAYCKEPIKWYEEQWDGDNEVYGTFGGMTRRYYDMLYNHMVNGGELSVTPEQVKIQIAVIEEAHRQNPLSKKY